MNQKSRKAIIMAFSLLFVGAIPAVTNAQFFPFGGGFGGDGFGGIFGGNRGYSSNSDNRNRNNSFLPIPLPLPPLPLPFPNYNSNSNSSQQGSNNVTYNNYNYNNNSNTNTAPAPQPVPAPQPRPHYPTYPRYPQPQPHYPPPQYHYPQPIYVPAPQPIYVPAPQPIIIQQPQPVIIQQPQPIIIAKQTYPVYQYPSQFRVNCVPDVSSSNFDRPVTWSAYASGGSAPYSYYWSGTEYYGNANTASVYVYYSTSGYKTMNVTVTSSDGQQASVTCGSVSIKGSTVTYVPPKPAPYVPQPAPPTYWQGEK